MLCLYGNANNVKLSNIDTMSLKKININYDHGRVWLLIFKNIRSRLEILTVRLCNRNNISILKYKLRRTYNLRFKINFSIFFLNTFEDYSFNIYVSNLHVFEENNRRKRFNFYEKLCCSLKWALTLVSIYL